MSRSPTPNTTLKHLLDSLSRQDAVSVWTDFPSTDQITITSVTEDSRRVQKGSLFVARPARTGNARPDSDLSPHDGRHFIPDAIARGASAVLVEHNSDITLDLPHHIALITTNDAPVASAHLAECFYGNPSDALSLVGITGTNGKTTIAWLVRCIMQHAGHKTGTLGTTGVYIGDTHTKAKLTTPFAEDLSSTLADMMQAQCEIATVEVSSHALDQHRADGLSFDIGVFTNLTGDHLDYHETMDQYAAAKSRLFAMLPSNGLAVVNADDPAHATMLKDCTANVVLCSASNPAYARVETLGANLSGMKLRLTGPFGAISQTVPLVGAHNAMNTLQAVVIAHRLGLSVTQIADALPHVTAPAGRLQPVTSSDEQIAVFVDFAHTDDALEKSLNAARSIVPANARLICVFGCGGDRDRTKRPRMGRVAYALSDVVVVTSDNPRTEDPLRVIDDILAGLPDGVRNGDAEKTVHVDHVREQAVAWAIQHAQQGDVIVIAGKGHEDYQLLPDGKGGILRRDFDDRRVARAALDALTPHAL
ncbi:MAG: UDP-N-acetylmuramoyl-L-alanyl-D-glutamate--2,6-diaminopimelate ligase [Phycisphaeraceae bacterium]|nr:UDP-N-acetylmuramoyl-L-alanyl-D-glutamate--2,6-diaminopimelate ligase [Phycisphaerales bacterium]MCB9858950.1 UDP-N-acetylmuramoyl-L-alanyl-D-glutamate--2,6-diaminopimelate ligase [Phycisphaeraceae bacterium]